MRSITIMGQLLWNTMGLVREIKRVGEGFTVRQRTIRKTTRVLD
jgi:hypothetical protein